MFNKSNVVSDGASIRESHRLALFTCILVLFCLCVSPGVAFLLAQAERRVGLTTPNKPPGTALTPALPGAPLPDGV